MTKFITKPSANVQGVSFLVLAMLIISIQTITVKWISGDYPLLEIVIFRSLVALPLTILIFRLEGKQGLPTTQRHKLEYARGAFLFLSYRKRAKAPRFMYGDEGRKRC